MPPPRHPNRTDHQDEQLIVDHAQGNLTRRTLHRESTRCFQLHRNPGFKGKNVHSTKGQKSDRQAGEAMPLTTSLSVPSPPATTMRSYSCARVCSQQPCGHHLVHLSGKDQRRHPCCRNAARAICIRGRASPPLTGLAISLIRISIHSQYGNKCLSVVSVCRGYKEHTSFPALHRETKTAKMKA